jgi:hypothetical protein
VGDLVGDELQAATRAFVVEENARAAKEPVALAVVDGDPVAVDLGDAVGAARVERRLSRCGTSMTLPNISLLLAW